MKAISVPNIPVNVPRWPGIYTTEKRLSQRGTDGRHDALCA